MRARLTLLVAAMAFVPLAAAQVETAASTLSSPAASVTLNGPLMDWTASPAADSMQLRLSATHVRMELDNASFIQVGAASLGTEEPSTRISDHIDSTWTGTNWFNQSSIYVVARRANLTIADADLQLGLPQQGCLEQPMFMPGRAPLCPPLASTVQVVASAEQFVLTGSFDVYLWGWRGSLTSDGRTDTFWTGIEYGAPQMGPTPFGPSERRFAKLAVEGGVLEMVFPESQVTMQAATVQVQAVMMELEGSTASTADNALAVVSAAPSVLQVDFLQGDLHWVDGSVTAVRPASEGNGGVWAWLGVSFLLTFLALAVGAPARGWQHLRAATRSLAIGNPAAASRHAQRAQRYPWLRTKATLLAVMGLLRSGQLEAAEGQLREHGQAFSLPARDFLAAFLLASRGDQAAAARRLRAAIAGDAAYLAEARHHPQLASLLGQADLDVA